MEFNVDHLPEINAFTFKCLTKNVTFTVEKEDFRLFPICHECQKHCSKDFKEAFEFLQNWEMNANLMRIAKSFKRLNEVIAENN